MTARSKKTQKALIAKANRALNAPPPPTPHKYTVVAQNWEESEAGWGTRPDGYTLHLTIEDCNAWIGEYYKRCNNKLEAPELYCRTCGVPMPLTVGPETFAKLQENAAKGGKGFRGDHGSSTPRSGTLP